MTAYIIARYLKYNNGFYDFPAFHGFLKSKLLTGFCLIKYLLFYYLDHFKKKKKKRQVVWSFYPHPFPFLSHF